MCGFDFEVGDPAQYLTATLSPSTRIIRSHMDLPVVGKYPPDKTSGGIESIDMYVFGPPQYHRLGPPMRGDTELTGPWKEHLARTDDWHDYAHCSDISPAAYAILCPIPGAAEKSGVPCDAAVPFNEFVAHIRWNHLSPHAQTVHVGGKPYIFRWTCPLSKSTSGPPEPCGEIIDVFKADLPEECDVVTSHVSEIMAHICGVHGKDMKGAAFVWKQENGTKGWVSSNEIAGSASGL